MEDQSLNPIFQVTNPNYGKSSSDVFQERIRKMRQQALESQMQQIQDTRGQLSQAQGKGINKGAAIAGALGQMVAPQSNAFNNVIAMEQQRRNGVNELRNSLNKQNKNLSSAANAMVNSDYQQGNFGRQKELMKMQGDQAARLAKLKASLSNSGSSNAPLRKLNANQITKVNEGNSLPAMLDDVSKMIQDKGNENLFSPIRGFFAKHNPYDVRSQTLDAQLRARSQAFGRFMEGGVLRKEDEEKYRKMFPQIGDEKEVAQNKLNTVRRLLMQKQNSDISALKQQGFDVSGVDKGFKVPSMVSFSNKTPGKNGSSPKSGKEPDFESMSNEELAKYVK